MISNTAVEVDFGSIKSFFFSLEHLLTLGEVLFPNDRAY